MEVNSFKARMSTLTGLRVIMKRLNLENLCGDIEPIFIKTYCKLFAFCRNCFLTIVINVSEYMVIFIIINGRY